jgi:hypothetical protein
MSFYVGWAVGPTEHDTWTGDILVQGLSDSLSTQFARMRCAVRPSELVGAYATDEASASLTRRLLLVGCHVELTAEGDTVVLGSALLSRPVVLKPCGEPAWRAAFHQAMQAACVALDPLGGLVVAALPGALPTPTLCTLAFTSNKQRPILQLLPVVVVGLEERAQQPPRRSQEGEGGAAEAETEAATAAAAAAAAAAVAAGGAPAQQPLLCGKVVAAKDPATGLPFAPIFLKLVPESRLNVLPRGILEVTNTRSIFRAQAAFGLLAYKGQGPWAALGVRAVDLERDDDAALFLPRPRAAPPAPASFISALVGGSASASSASDAQAAEAAAAAAAAAGPAPLVSPLLGFPALLAGLGDLLELLPGAQSVVEVGGGGLGSPAAAPVDK